LRGPEVQHLVTPSGIAAGDNADATPEHVATHDLAIDVIPQQIADLVVERNHGFLAMAPGHHAELESFKRLLPVMLRGDRFEPGFFKVAGCYRLIVFVAVGHIKADVAFPMADQRRQWPQTLKTLHFTHL